jgi:leucyl aminopeptidase
MFLPQFNMIFMANNLYLNISNNAPKLNCSSHLISLINLRDKKSDTENDKDIIAEALQKVLSTLADHAPANLILNNLLARSLTSLREEKVSFNFLNQDLSELTFYFLPKEAKFKNQIDLTGTRELRKIATNIVRFIRSEKSTFVSLLLPNELFAEECHLSLFLEALFAADYKFDDYKSSGKDENLVINIEICLEKSFSQTEKLIEVAKKTANAQNFARNLVNLPPNDCNPHSVEELCKELAKESKLKLTVIDESTLREMGANSLISVGQGSCYPARLIKLEYNPQNTKTSKIALVGKGVTFDSGGLSLKPGPAMETMKCDMAGAAVVISAIKCIADLNIDLAVTAYVPLVENMVSSRSTKPGDIVKSLKGKTIEILNTDAEGRLILADALTLAEQDGNEIIVDVATLTGAIVVGLGTQAAGYFGRDFELCHRLESAATRAGEALWRMPLIAECNDSLKSVFADLKNISGEMWGGSIYAACFLGHFVETAKWLHLDIAGVAFDLKETPLNPKGASGFGVRTLVNFVKSFLS